MRVAVKLTGFKAPTCRGPRRRPRQPAGRGDCSICRPSGEKYGRFRFRQTAGGLTRISVFIDNDAEDPQTACRKLPPRSEISVSLLRPLRGG
jgi:hypothetical protein